MIQFPPQPLPGRAENQRALARSVARGVAEGVRSVAVGVRRGRGVEQAVVVLDGGRVVCGLVR